ncbi:MAG TPA: hypothetical protein VFN87_10975 [Solirubrobacteraceae bacterium]|nr:hypothetical protein [Solirubrobacteraceae bacterium]
MEAHRQPWETPPASLQDRPLPGLATAFSAAVAAADIGHARRLIADAADAGATTGRLYVDVVRPALQTIQQRGGRTRARLAAGIGEAIVADLAARLPASSRDVTGRAAVLSCRATGIEAVDGSVATGYLEADRWSVERLGTDDLDDRRAALAGAGAFELAAAVTAGPEDALRLAPICSELRRLADPPVIVLCDFSGRSPRNAASSALGADAVAHDPEELVRCATAGLPGPGRRRWGVRLSRANGGLTMAPTGRLDAVSVGRLADVALTRSGTFSRLVLDLRELAEFDAGGVRELAVWRTLVPCEGIDLTLVADARARRELDRVGTALPWRIAEPATADL